MWVKICANTSAEDALAAIRFGADAVGFVFASSKRQVTAEQVRAITAELPQDPERVGVFHNLSAEEIAHVAETARLTTAQLHGDFDSDLLGDLTRLAPELRLIHVVHWDLSVPEPYSAVVTQLERIAELAPNARVLVDAKVNGATGGTGKSFDWENARALFSGFRGLKIILAGGLRPENVAGAIRIVQPTGIDVASGVESEPGKKDHAKLKAFIENARRA
jgi:phosphoribosylanthranilate isomerase